MQTSIIQTFRCGNEEERKEGYENFASINDFPSVTLQKIIDLPFLPVKGLAIRTQPAFFRWGVAELGLRGEERVNDVMYLVEEGLILVSFRPVCLSIKDPNKYWEVIQTYINCGWKLNTSAYFKDECDFAYEELKDKSKFIEQHYAVEMDGHMFSVDKFELKVLKMSNASFKLHDFEIKQ